MFPLLARRPARPEAAMMRRTVDPLLAMREGIENLFDRFFDDRRFPVEWTELRDWAVEETDKEVVMRLEVPGFEPTEIELRVEGDVLVLHAEHPETKEGREPAEHRFVRRYEYRFVMPFGTDASHIEATYRNGILELHLPRLPEVQPRRIEVKT